MIRLKTKEEIQILKEGGSILAKIVADLAKEVKPGVSSKDLDNMAREAIFENGGKPAFLNYRPSGSARPFPATLCFCINDEIVHGVPNEYPKIIKEGDLVTLDMGMIYKGLYTDHAVTVAVGKISKEAGFLMDKTREALGLAIKQCVVGNTVGDIGATIQKVADDAGLYVMDSLTGHGVGYAVHEDPYVPNVGRKGEGEELKPGLVIAIEPMFSLGTHEIKLAEDDWTYKTADGSLSAQFEHTIAITEQGPIVLTKK